MNTKTIRCEYDLTQPTRNGRRYSIECFSKCILSDLMQERLKTHTLFLVANIDMDNKFTEEIDPRYVIGSVDKLSTVDNKLVLDGELFCDSLLYHNLYPAIEAGLCKFVPYGIGNTIKSKDGIDEVDPDSYELLYFDLVPNPAMDVEVILENK